MEAAIAASLAGEPATPSAPAWLATPAAVAPATVARRSPTACAERHNTGADDGDGDLVTDSSQGVCEVAVKLPTSKRVVSKFGAAQPLRSVADWLQGKGWDMQRHRLTLTHPRTVLEDLEKSLKGHGLTGAREALVLERAPAA